MTPDGKVVAVAHDNSPFISTYDWVEENAWIKRNNPTSPPTGTGRGISLTPDGKVVAVAYSSSPYILTYDWVENAWIKRNNPTSPTPILWIWGYP